MSWRLPTTAVGRAGRHVAAVPRPRKTSTESRVVCHLFIRLVESEVSQTGSRIAGATLVVARQTGRHKTGPYSSLSHVRPGESAPPRCRNLSWEAKMMLTMSIAARVRKEPNWP